MMEIPGYPREYKVDKREENMRATFFESAIAGRGF